MTFNVGDRVRITGSIGHHRWIGLEGIVVDENDADFGYPRIQLDGERPDGLGRSAFSTAGMTLEKIEPTKPREGKVIYETEPKRYIIQEKEKDGESWRDEGGYSRDSEAIEEADRLQGLFPNDRYRVIDTDTDDVD